MFSITIPKHVKIIGKNAFEFCTDLSKIKISENSELETICSQAFSNTIIDHLYFPAKLKELQSGWCESMKKLRSISISPNNRFFTIIENKLIVGKSNPKIDDYDILYLVLPGLTNMTLLSNIKKINDYAFYKSKKLKFIKIPEDSKLEIIGKFAFYKRQIKSIDIPKSVTIIDDNAFNRSDLEIVNFDEDSNLKIIGESAFCSTSIKSVKIPKHVSDIKDNAFNYCTSLSDVLFYDDAEIENIGKRAFRMTSIKKFQIPKKVKIIKERTFNECRNLEEITFSEPSETKCFESSAFLLSPIKRLTFPSSLTKLERGWNEKTYSLINIEIPKDNKNFKMIDNEIIISNSLSVKSKRQDSDSDDDDEYDEEKVDVDKNFDVICFVPRNVKEVKIPNYIKYIDSCSFSGCEKLEKVFISKESELIEFKPKSFSSTSSLHSIFIPKHVKIIGSKCFNNCSKLKTIEFAKDSQLEIIGSKSFSTIPIENISIPDSVKIIRKKAFKSDDSSSKNTELSSFSENSQLQYIDEETVNSPYIKTFKIPNHVKVIKSKAFNGCYELEKVDISENSELTTIENKAFCACGIEKFYFPPLLKDINDFLIDCSKITEISISPKNKFYSTINDGKLLLGKLEINDDNFNVILYSTRDVRTIIIPSYIKKINSGAFKKCEHLNEVEFEENSQLEIIDKKSFKKSYIDYIEIPDSVKIIDDSAFAECKYLRKIKISEESKLKFIGKKAFFRTDFDKIFIPKYVEKIDKCAFMNSSLEYIRFAKDSLLNEIESSSFSNTKVYHLFIPNGVKEIKRSTFSGCKDLSQIEFTEDSELQIIHHYAFNGSKISKLNFPPKLKELENEWASNIKNLCSIKISPNNENFKIIDKKMIVEKSNPNNNQFDVLTFVMRDADNVIIPSYIKTIKKNSFQDCKKLETIQFSENSELELIDDYAFYHAKCESNLSIPKNVKIVGDYSFAKLKTSLIEFPNDSLLEQIGKNAFENSNIKKFVFPNKIKFVTFNIFESCHNLEEVQMSDNVELIDPFIDFKLYLKTINIPAKINEFKAIYSFPSLSNIFISPKNKYFNNIEGKLIVKKTNPNNDVYDTIYYTFKNIGNVTIPSYFTKIDSSIFSYKNIEKVSFLDDSLLKIIKNSAFESSTITEICIPKHVKVIDSKSFANCSKLTKVEFVKDSELKIIKSDSFKHTSITVIDIPKSVTAIESSAFECSDLKEINFTEDSELEFIGCRAFSETLITKLKIPQKVKILKGRTFSECKKLEEITFSEPSETKSFSGAPFFGSSIKRLTFPSSLTKLYRGWNENTNSLINIEILKENKNFKMIDNEIIISNSLSYFDKREYCYQIRKSSSDDDDDDDEKYSEEEIEEEEEENKKDKNFDVICFVPRNVKEVKIPNYIKYIDSYSFSGCENLEKVFISKESELIEFKPKSFSSTSSLHSIFIPKHVKIIGSKCFNNCSKLKTIEFAKDSQLEIIDSKCFSNCEKLSKVEINGDQKISIYDGAFESTALKGFSFPKFVMSYDTDIFNYCRSLKSIEFLCDDKFELLRHKLIEQVSVISFPNAKYIKIYKSCYGNDKNEVLAFTIPYTKIEYGCFE